VTVYDGKFSSTATVTITVKDINDQTPKFDSNIYSYNNVVSEGVNYATSPYTLATVSTVLSFIFNMYLYINIFFVFCSITSK